MKLKKCRKCKEDLPLDSFTSTQAHYCNNCRIIRKFEQERARKERYIKRLKKKKRKERVVISLPKLKQKTQTTFNAWVRERDKDEPCISCRKMTASHWEAGHFWPMGSKSALRYNPDNCHKQCRSCNHFKRGNLLEYRIYLIKKIGQDKVDWLEEHRNDIKKWTREELNQIIKEHKI